MPDEFDFTSKYTIKEYGGIAFYVTGYEKIPDADESGSEWSGIEVKHAYTGTS